MADPRADFRSNLTAQLDAQLSAADAALGSQYPGAASGRHPVHTVYVPADRCTAQAIGQWGPTALELLASYAPNAGELASATGQSADDVAQVYDRLTSKLSREPIEDLRADFEDGYGVRSDDAEDAHLQQVVEAFASLQSAGTLPAWRGIRFKSFEAPTRARGLRTLVDYLYAVRDAGLLDADSAPHTVLTLPKVTSVDQVSAMTAACGALERELRLPARSLTFEIQVETPQAILGSDGLASVAPMVHVTEGRVTSLVYGTYDYSAGLGIAAPYQALDHPAADHAKAVMQVAAAQTGARVCDGSTNVVAFGDREAAHATWALHTALVERSLVRGIYQGWDMHPGHLVSRYLANFLFFRAALPGAAARLATYLDRSAGGDVMDEPATARMLAAALLRGVHCGALDSAEVETACGAGVSTLSELSQ
ncbi:DUF6986 family protein [Flexivirga meconopsidis]|jgi:hypothetical protein|uniref:DUF6986 family protein n=1 Tax=Flexivirga meconopsidis TaxID=2977121 RepID=UPI00223EA496|nr:aldolase/citrate lyase family protein [Flexivirga meconopsidis]